MSITYNDLISRAEQVRDESEIGANTATRVGQLLADIIQWCQDNNADLGEYLLNFTAHLNERGGILNWFQSRIVLLKTMGSAYDDVSVGSLSDGDVYYDSQGNWIYEKSGSAAINGIHPSKGVFYVNLANKTAYQWDGTTFQVEIESGGGGGASTVTAFEGYEVVASVGDLPEQGNPTTGYIVGTHIYAYVGENGDTADGAYQDLGELAAAGLSVTTNGDGTFTIHAAGNTYTINLNHTHEGMAKLVVDAAEDLPDMEDMESDTIYGAVEDGEISVLYIGGIPFYGGGGSVDPEEPRLVKPSGSAAINLGDCIDAQTPATASITIKARKLNDALTIELDGNDYAFGSTQPTGVTVESDTELTITAAAATATAGVNIVVECASTSANAGCTLGIKTVSGGTDGIDEEFSLITNYLDTDGLVCHWNYADSPSSGNWVDRVNSMKLVMYGSATRVSSGYKLDYHSTLDASNECVMRLDYNQQTGFNDLFSTSKEMTAIVKCKVKFHSTTYVDGSGVTKDNPRAMIIDFGSEGGKKGYFCTQGRLMQNGNFYIRARAILDINNPDPTISGYPNVGGAYNSIPSGISFPVGEYVDVTVKVGIIKKDGYKHWIGECGEAIFDKQHIESGSADWPLNMIGCKSTGDPDYFGAPFCLGIGYSNQGMYNNDMKPYRAEVIYQKVLIYNKAK